MGEKQESDFVFELKESARVRERERQRERERLHKATLVSFSY